MELYSVLEEAAELVDSGERQRDYLSPGKNFDRIAKVWSLIFGVEVTPRQVGWAMVAVKMVRDLSKPKRDNLVDTAGYVRCIERAEDELG